MAEEKVEQPVEAQSEPATEVLQVQPDQLETQRADYEAQVGALKTSLSQAVSKYRSKLLEESPEVPQELVNGDTVEEVDVSFEAACKVVRRIRERLETETGAERIPAGAPARGLPDMSTLSPTEKIAYGLAQR